jgi:hypothetical protein
MTDHEPQPYDWEFYSIVRAIEWRHELERRLIEAGQPASPPPSHAVIRQLLCHRERQRAVHLAKGESCQESD